MLGLVVAIAVFIAALLWLETPGRGDLIMGIVAGGAVMTLLEFWRGRGSA